MLSMLQMWQPSTDRDSLTGPASLYCCRLAGLVVRGQGKIGNLAPLPIIQHHTSSRVEVRLTTSQQLARVGGQLGEEVNGAVPGLDLVCPHLHSQQATAKVSVLQSKQQTCLQICFAGRLAELVLPSQQFAR